MMKQQVAGSFKDEAGKELAAFNGWVEPKPDGGMTSWRGGGTLSKPIVNVVQTIYLHLDDGRRVQVMPSVPTNDDLRTNQTVTTVSFLVMSGTL